MDAVIIHVDCPSFLGAIVMTGQERELIKNALKDWSQFKLKEQSISKEHPELIPILQKELNEIPEYESIGCLAKSIVFDIQLKRCKNCGKLMTYHNSVNKKPLIEYCSLHCAHSSEELKKKKAETTKKHYGVEHPLQNKELSKKFINTMHERFGECPQLSDEIKSKRIKTNLERYGVECALSNQKVRDKIKQTNLERYGCEIASMSDEIKEREKNSNIEKYGVVSTAMLRETQEKAIATNRERYGCNWHIQSESQKDKIRQSVQKKYGKDWISQVDSVKKSMSDTNHKKTYKLFERWKEHVVPMFSIEEYDGWKEDKKYLWKCQKCGHVFYWNKFDCSGRVPMCMNCSSHSGHSSMEKEIVEYIRSIYDGKILVGNRKLLGNMELDIYIPEKNVAIELDGLYWHNEERHSEGYHVMKTNKCLEAGVYLIHIFEDEWLNRQSGVKSIIMCALGVSLHEINLDDCEIKNVDHNKAKKFHSENNALYGNRASRMNYGLFFNNELVYLMSFSSSRFNLNYDYQLVALSSKKACHIDNAENKILSFFREKHPNKTIVFYADRRYVSRSYCHNVGFKFVKSTHVNYFWTHQRKRFSRNQCRMHILEILGDKYDSSLDVEENMSFAGWKKIYDCGFDVFEV